MLTRYALKMWLKSTTLLNWIQAFYKYEIIIIFIGIFYMQHSFIFLYFFVSYEQHLIRHYSFKNLITKRSESNICDITRANHNTLYWPIGQPFSIHKFMYIPLFEIDSRRLESHVTIDVLSIPCLSLISHFYKGPEVSVRSGPGDFTKGPIRYQTSN